MADPIWKDHYSNLGAVASQYFRIEVGGNIIYQGRAFRAASSGNLEIKINDICADYMAKKPGGPSLNFPITFQVKKSANGSTWSSVETVTFNDDWSYVSGFNPQTDGMAFPITGNIDLRQKLYQTRYSMSGITATAYYGATTRSISLTVLNTPYSTDMIRSLARAGSGYVEFDCATYATYSGKKLTAVKIGGVTYNVTKKCPMYCLYYKNPFGGYDHLLCEGKGRRNHSNQRDNFVTVYNNGYFQREEWTFQTEVTEGWSLTTGFLTNEQSSRMPYLLDSPDVYLVELSSPINFIPVTIATDSFQVKRYSASEGMATYSFEVTKSQKEYRR